MNKLEQFEILKRLETNLKEEGYILKIIRQDYSMQHFEFLVTNDRNYGLVYGSFSINEVGTKLICVYQAFNIYLPDRFIDVINLMENFQK